MIETLYSQVFWTGLPPVDIPAEVQAQFAGGKAMAVVGFEVDGVVRTPGGDVSVPESVVYNHHHNTNLAGADARIEEIRLSGPDDPQIKEHGLAGMSHHLPFTPGSTHYVVKNRNAAGSVPNHLKLGAANGGEDRKSFHGFAPGYAQIVKSPKTLQITPMYIDTWNRDKMNHTVDKDGNASPFAVGPVRILCHSTRSPASPPPPHFLCTYSLGRTAPLTQESCHRHLCVALQLPRNSFAAPGAEYSGLLECPVTTRLRKDIAADYAVAAAGNGCDAPAGAPTETDGSGTTGITTAAECFQAAAKELTLISNGLAVTNTSIDREDRPPGCSVASDGAGQGVTVMFNHAAHSSGTCGSGETFRAGQTESLVKVSVALDLHKAEATVTLTGPAGVTHQLSCFQRISNFSERGSREVLPL
jgi:hypothetical protein